MADSTASKLDFEEAQTEIGKDAAFAAEYGGSPIERRVFDELVRRKFVYGVDFQFGADQYGGLSSWGNSKIHFILDGLKLAIRVQGFGWQSLGQEAHTLDVLQELYFEGKGFYVADLLALEIMQNVRRVVGFALEYKETSAAASVLR